MGGNVSGDEMAKGIAAQFEKMMHIARSSRASFIARVTSTRIIVEHPRF
jgi:hypothetical protein